MAELQVEQGAVAYGDAIRASTTRSAAPALAIAPELDALLRRAAWLGQADGEPATASFTSIFLALMSATDPVSRWVQGKVVWIGPASADLLRRREATTGGKLGAREGAERLARGPTPEELAAVEVAWTASATGVIETARALAAEVGSAALEVRHVLASYFCAPLGSHVEDAIAWKLDREAWATRFRCYVAAANPAEAEAWRAIHERVFTRPLSTGVERANRWATAVARDATADSLDAHAVLSGILLDGIARVAKPVTATQLVRCLGDVDAVAKLVGHPSTGVGPITLPYGEEMRPILDRALVFATATQPTVANGRSSGFVRLHIRHLIAALLTDRRPLAAFAILRRAKRTQDGVLAQLRRSIEQLADPADDLERWAALLDEFRDDVVASYDNDEAHGEDRLNIRPDVRALAAVLASTQVTPPLSVGLFGDWGSGKSFFMRQMREQIDRLAIASRDRPGESWFCGKRGEVVQIEVNAWHYMDADLWSSLAVCVFDALSDRFKAVFEKGCVAKLASLQERKQALEADEQALAEAARKLDERLGWIRVARAARDVSGRELLAGVADDLARDAANDRKIAAAANELRIGADAVTTELARARADLQGVTGTIARVWRARSSPVRLAAVGLVLAIPVAVGAIAWLVAGAREAVIGALAGTVATLGGLGGAIHKAATRFRGLLDGALESIDQIESKARARKTAEELHVEADRERIAAQIAEVERTRLDLAKRQAEVAVELEQLRRPDKRSLRDFILQRAAADDYRKNLGVVSAVHKDFKELASWLGASGDPPNVERIVLYIDDLDRCSPERVVEVLQAIHVILSLPLFVVVVAVDSRWLLDSLSAYYRRQFPAGVADLARPQQYLEKIFQIPFTLLPMSPTGYTALAGSLLGRHLDEEPEPDAPVSEAAASTTPAAASPGAPAATTVRRAAPARSAASQVELTPRGLRLEPSEARYLEQLTGLVGSPRATKRLVNLYRIVRATLDDQALDRLVSGGYRVTQICLALVVGNPGLGAELFGEILGATLASQPALASWCARRAEALKEADVRDRASLRELTARAGEFADWPAVKAAVRRVARFSFETGRVLGYYTADDPPPASPQ